ncbi:glycerophosphodiester phosphodiesterase [Salinibacterium soli]|uniref:Glycerophosphodiester phosphodiesterase family protein n=1 Tax=Antiquaquibacter soli TaxID=3064523 RepID=A0ABT9BKT3_9MICO|nr:glycerophosphodiester phosphodiesterase family protein [Protaetiibacter sp. WY-16]MDO7881626.1 glycerophosphodiester phosphodiesterase family protein [Protaetiibacter sp. WY-16]
MATARQPDARTSLLAAAAALALVLAIVLSPDTVGTAAANPFSSLRSPGEMGFVAGHRGDSDAGPENTLPALAGVIDSGAEFVETDVQLTADGVPILMHDWTLDRTTDGTGPVWAATWEQISRLDAGSWYDADYRGTRVPLFEEFLAILAPSPTHAIVELKGSWTPHDVEIVQRLVTEYGVADQVVFASFDIMTLRAAQLVAPGVQRAIISREVNGEPADLAAECGAIAIIVSKAFVLARPELVDRIHAAELGVMVYTVNDSDAWMEAIELGVDGIITDTPGELDRWRHSG